MTFKCDFCGKIFSSGRGLSTHVGMKHKDAPRPPVLPNNPIVEKKADWDSIADGNNERPPPICAEECVIYKAQKKKGFWARFKKNKDK